MKLYFDLETIPGTAAHLRQEAEDATRPSAAIKKPETLAKWHEEERPAAVAATFHKFGLAPETGEIVSIAAVTDDDAEFVQCRAPGESEAELLAAFFAWVAERQASRVQVLTDGTGQTWPMEPAPVHLVAHNAGFDVGFLRNRCIALGIKPSFRLPGGMDRPGKHYTCTMLEWAGFGGKVYDAWQAGRVAEIAAYNLNDARTVKAIAERMEAVCRRRRESGSNLTIRKWIGETL